jgi:hypothetical protein
MDDNGEQVTAFAVELEQRQFLRGAATPAAGRASVVALGVEVSVHANEEAFAASPASLLSPPDDNSDPEPPPPHFAKNGWPWPPGWAPNRSSPTACSRRTSPTRTQGSTAQSSTPTGNGGAYGPGLCRRARPHRRIRGRRMPGRRRPSDRPHTGPDHRRNRVPGRLSGTPVVRPHTPTLATVLEQALSQTVRT